jgi:hypothetical protein
LAALACPATRPAASTAGSATWRTGAAARATARTIDAGAAA